MRVIGQLANESLARTFGDYLYVQGIENKIESQPDASWAIWVNDEDKLENAAALLEEFRANPTAGKYQSQAKAAADLRAESQKSHEAWRKRLRDRRHLFRPLTGYGVGPLTFVLIVASVVVFFLSRFGTEIERVQVLAITHLWAQGPDVTAWLPGLSELRQGQLWRLITPILIHWNVLHILFNMWWLRDLGSMIEARQSTMQFALLVLVTAAGSNLGEYWLGHTAVFGGMSGVLYALLGYIWMRGKFDPGSGLFLHPTTVAMMLVWLVVCYAGFVGNIANAAHVVGLLMGMAWGYLSSLCHR
jgi:GlpG protein